MMEKTTVANTNRSQRFRLALRALILAAFVAAFVWFFFSHKAEFHVLTHMPWYLLILIALSQLVVILTNTAFQISLLKVYQLRISWWESFVVVVKSSVINFFGFLQGGTGYRAYYLKKHYNLSYARFALLFTANYLVVFFICALFGMIGSLLQAAHSGHATNYGVVVFFAVATFALLVLMFISPSRLPGNSKFMLRIKGVLAEWDHIISSKKRVFGLFLIGLVQFWALTASFFLELRAIHASTNLPGLMVYSAIAGFSILVALTPAAIGFRETLLIFARQALGVSVSVIVLSATVDRIVYFFLLLALSIFTQEHVVRIVGKKLPKEI